VIPEQLPTPLTLRACAGRSLRPPGRQGRQPQLVAKRNPWVARVEHHPGPESLAILIMVKYSPVRGEFAGNHCTPGTDQAGRGSHQTPFFAFFGYFVVKRPVSASLAAARPRCVPVVRFLNFSLPLAVNRPGKWEKRQAGSLSHLAWLSRRNSFTSPVGPGR